MADLVGKHDATVGLPSELGRAQELRYWWMLGQKKRYSNDHKGPEGPVLIEWHLRRGWLHPEPSYPARWLNMRTAL